MDEMTARERSGDPFYGEETKPVKLPVAIKECARCGGKFVPTAAKGHASLYCKECMRKMTQNAREKSLDARRSRKAETGMPCFHTSIRWYRTQDKLPETSQEVFAISDGGLFCSIHYSKVLNKFNAYDHSDGKSAFPVAYWAYIPADLQSVMDAVFKTYCEKTKEAK